MDLFKYSSRRDVLVLQTGLFMSFASGCIMPTYGIVIGRIVEMFDPALSAEVKREMMLSFVWVMVLVSVGTFVTSYLDYALL